MQDDLIQTMSNRQLILIQMEQQLAICRLQGNAALPGWVPGKGFWSVTRSEEEVSIVADERRIPDGVEADKGWRAFRVKGTLDLTMTGILSSLLHPLAEAGISVFTISTYLTDYLLVKAESYEDAQRVLGSCCTFEPDRPGSTKTF
jgi:hypothetical protein